VAATAERRIVLNADDYGFTSGVSAGILECVAAGVVTSVSMMVNTPGFEDGARRLAALARRPGVGLHLNLTAGAPVLGAREVPSLVGAGGGFLSLGMLAARALLGALDAADVEKETLAQIARLSSAVQGVDHLDSHQHVHALPRLNQAVRRAAAAAGIRRVRRPVEPRLSHPGALKRLAILASWYAASGGAEAGAARVTGIGLKGGPKFGRDLLARLDEVPVGLTEVIVHPGRSGPELAAWDPYLGERDAELEALLSAPLRERLARGDLVLTDFRAG
jgi:predicted glycoside hydrolase/deacetylase ChbG (UPF0249 family)